MKKYVVGIILWALVAAQLLFIFAMSSQDATASGKLSVRVTRVVARVLTPGFAELPAARQNRVVRKVHRFTRKMAHLTEYAFLGALICLALRKKGMAGVVGAICACVLLALLDEARQMYSAGRTPLATDVLIDSVGATIGALVSFGLVRLTRRRKSAKTRT